MEKDGVGKLGLFQISYVGQPHFSSMIQIVYCRL